MIPVGPLADGILKVHSLAVSGHVSLLPMRDGSSTIEVWVLATSPSCSVSIRVLKPASLSEVIVSEFKKQYTHVVNLVFIPLFHNSRANIL